MSDMNTVINMLKDMSSRLARVESKVGTGGSAAPPAAPASGGGSSNSVVAAYDAWLDAAMAPVDKAALELKEAGFKSAKKCANFLRKGAMGVRVVVEAGTKCKEPSTEEFMAFMQKNVWDVTKKGKMVRTKKLGKHYEKALAECMDVFSWPTKAGEVGPSAYIESSVGSVEYHQNRARMEYKKTDEGASHMAYCAGVKAFISSLRQFVVKNCMAKKFAWKSNGIALSEFAPGGAPAAAASNATATAAAPAPAPAAAAVAEKEAPVLDMGAMFAELSKGCGITKNMKHVKKSQMVHKNKDLRKSGVVKVAKKKSKAKKAKAAKPRPAPKVNFQRGQKMWYVENQLDDANVEVVFKDNSQAGYLYKCDKARVTFKGRGKNISLVGCNGTTVIFDSLLSGIECTNCKRIKIIVLGACNMFQLDKTEGGKIVLSKESSSTATFATSMCFDLNIEFPDPEEEDNTITKPIPSAFEHKIENGRIASEVSHLYG